MSSLVRYLLSKRQTSRSMPLRSHVLRRCFAGSSRRPANDQHVTYFQSDGGKRMTAPVQRSEPQVIVVPTGDSSSMRQSRRAAFITGMIASPLILTVVGFILINTGLLVFDASADESSTSEGLKSHAPRINEYSSGSAHGQSQGFVQQDSTEDSPTSPSARILELENQLLQERLEKLRDTQSAEERAQQTQSLLDSANDSQLKVHKVLFDIITTSSDDNIVLDEAILESRPIVLSDQSRLPASNAALIRVLDREGKNKILVLGIDVDYHEHHKSVSSRFPSDCYNLDEWMCDLADDLARANGNSEEGLAIYLYSNRVIVDVHHETGYRWMTRYRQSDFPPGFPLKQMRQIKKVHGHNGNLSNKVQREALATKEPPQEAS